MALMNLIYKKQVKAQIGTITVDASVSEDHTASSTVTSNPVEEGANVADHVKLEPLRLSIQGVISDTPLDFEILNSLAKGDFKGIAKNFTSGISAVLGGTSRSTEQYLALLELRKSREPFQVITGLKVYQNMILTNLTVNRTASTGKAIHFTAEMEEIRIVQSQTVGKEALGKGVKNLASKTKNLGAKTKSWIDPIKDLKKHKGVTSTLGSVASFLKKGI